MGAIVMEGVGEKSIDDSIVVAAIPGFIPTDAVLNAPIAPNPQEGSEHSEPLFWFPEAFVSVSINMCVYL